jgi:hypothetical protein
MVRRFPPHVRWPTHLQKLTMSLLAASWSLEAQSMADPAASLPPRAVPQAESGSPSARLSSHVRPPSPAVLPALEAVDRAVDGVVSQPKPDLAQQINDYPQEVMGGGAWSPEPEPRPASVDAAGPSPSAAASASRPPTAASRPPQPSQATRHRPGRARRSQALRGVFLPLGANEEDGDRSPDQPPLQPPRSFNRRSPIDFDPPPRATQQQTAQATVAVSPPPPPPTPNRARRVIDGGRHFWTDDETLFLVRKAMAIHSENGNPFATLVKWVLAFSARPS